MTKVNWSWTVLWLNCITSLVHWPWTVHWPYKMYWPWNCTLNFTLTLNCMMTLNCTLTLNCSLTLNCTLILNCMMTLNSILTLNCTLTLNFILTLNCMMNVLMLCDDLELHNALGTVHWPWTVWWTFWCRRTFRRVSISWGRTRGIYPCRRRDSTSSCACPVTPLSAPTNTNTNSILSSNTLGFRAVIH